LNARGHELLLRETTLNADAKLIAGVNTLLLCGMS